MDLQLTGRTAVITGAASGIGRATAVVMAGEGAQVVLVDLDKEGLAETGSLVAAAGLSRPAQICADLSSEAGVELAMTEALHRGAGADVLVSNAGICQFRSLAELTDDDWQHTLQVNLLATVRAVRYLLPAMRERGHGSIVITASDLAKQPERSPADYQASKVALVSYMKTLALEEAQHGIRINAVAPGPIETGLWTRPGGLADNLAELHGRPRTEAVRHELALRQLPLGRIGRPEEVANVIAFLASDRASYVTGSTWDVGGGSVRGLF